MNKLYLILVSLLIASFASPGFAQKLTFSYDASGNQIERRWVCVNCLTNNNQAAAQKIANDSNIDLKKGEDFNAGRIIKVYPNPVSETLNVNWQTPEKIFLKSIEVFGMSGNRVFRATYAPGQLQAEIPFNRLPPGTYILIGYYSDSKTQSIKVIKI
ncbi:hypothetical protein HDC92_004577 [Pedobacter sp. AK017]|uniref:T9SS type A sorting domain-containing protein n=1 Tax=Pedobacter sp. AK017 TaxID=2723073 RepID=UPI0016127068|nr:T9SS type A sorting domain-containing protein [Pedobacter sp. AK017]MBB5440873.1 hypothetical protein [Pedobacter sp. AK017]